MSHSSLSVLTVYIRLLVLDSSIPTLVTPTLVERNTLTMTEAERAPATASAASPTLAAVSIKLPPFWPADPEVWFAQVEAQFTTRGVTAQKTRFDYVISSLSPEFAMEVRDLLLKPPAETPYDTLKAELIKRTAASEQRKLQQLVSGEELGDRKPTQLFRRMQQLLGDKLGTSADANSFLRELFLQRLPPNVRMVLASTDASMDLSKLADMADKVMEVATPTVSAITDTRIDPSEIKQLREEVARLADLVTPLTTRSRLRSTSRPRRPHSPAPQNPPPADSLCWYHVKYGEAARKCKDPCSWGNSQAGH